MDKISKLAIAWWDGKGNREIAENRHVSRPGEDNLKVSKRARLEARSAIKEAITPHADKLLPESQFHDLASALFEVPLPSEKRLTVMRSDVLHVLHKTTTVTTTKSDLLLYASYFASGIEMNGAQEARPWPDQDGHSIWITLSGTHGPHAPAIPEKRFGLTSWNHVNVDSPSTETIFYALDRPLLWQPGHILIEPRTRWCQCSDIQFYAPVEFA